MIGPAPARLVGCAQAALGLLLATRPAAAVAAAGGTAPHLAIVRVLGARATVQGVLLAARPRAGLFALAAATDLVHAATMAGAARRWPRYRRAALASGLLATALAVAELAVLRAGSGRSGARGVSDACGARA